MDPHSWESRKNPAACRSWADLIFESKIIGRFVFKLLVSRLNVILFQVGTYLQTWHLLKPPSHISQHPHVLKSTEKEIGYWYWYQRLIKYDVTNRRLSILERYILMLISVVFCHNMYLFIFITVLIQIFQAFFLSVFANLVIENRLNGHLPTI